MLLLLSFTLYLMSQFLNGGHHLPVAGELPTVLLYATTTLCTSLLICTSVASPFAAASVEVTFFRQVHYDLYLMRVITVNTSMY